MAAFVPRRDHFGPGVIPFGRLRPAPGSLWTRSDPERPSGCGVRTSGRRAFGSLFVRAKAFRRHSTLRNCRRCTFRDRFGPWQVPSRHHHPSGLRHDPSKRRKCCQRAIFLPVSGISALFCCQRASFQHVGSTRRIWSYYGTAHLFGDKGLKSRVQ